MKNFIYSTNYRKTLLILLAIGVNMLTQSFTYITPNTTEYIITQPKISITGKTGTNDWNLALQSYALNGKFSLLDGDLDNISDFSFGFQIHESLFDTLQQNSIVYEAVKRSQCNEFVFTQNKLMILPIMKMVHMIGDVKIMTGTHSSPLQLQYTIGAGEQIRIKGRQVIFLSEFGIKDERIKPGSSEDELIVYIDFTLVKKPINLMK